MIEEIIFTKASGAGNDFVIIDNMSRALRTDKSVLAQKLCSRHFGVGGDGLLLLEPSNTSQFTMEYYNSDGSHGGMCGNGGRCVARYAFLHGLAPEQMSFEALDFIYRAEVAGERVILTMKDPDKVRENVNIHVGAESYHAFFVNTGSPHLVIFVDDLNVVPVEQVGRTMRNDPLFSPDGTNVDFVQLIDSKVIRVRTYERGVESETLACGTGSVAAGVVSHSAKGMKLPISVLTQSGEYLKVHGTTGGSIVKSPKLEGSAHMLFTGRVLYDMTQHEIVDHT